MEISDPKWSMGAEGVRISFRVPTVAEAKAQCDAMVAGKRYALTVKELTKKRSLSANALMWAVLGEMAAALNQSGSRVTPDEIYRGYIRQTPNYYVAECWEDTLGKLQSTWEANGIGWLAEATEPVDEADGMEKWAVRLWYGSSQYDTRQMGNLIDAILQDAHAMGLSSDSVTALMEAYPDGQ